MRPQSLNENPCQTAFPGVLGVCTGSAGAPSVCLFLWEDGVWRCLPVWDKNLFYSCFSLCIALPKPLRVVGVSGLKNAGCAGCL